MKLVYGLDEIELDERSLVTVGTFDGVHHGHQSIIKYLVDRAKNKSGISVALSFDPHPRQVIAGVQVPLLTTIEERAELFAQLGLDRFVVIPFTKTFAETSARSFVVDILVKKIGLQEIVIGYDHGFGKGRQGDSELLQQLGTEYNFSVDIIPAQILEQGVVSSTRIREVLTGGGAVEEAGKLLDRPYGLIGSVIHGDGRGRTIGYPTANIAISNPNKVIPKRGVYAVRVNILGENAKYGAMMNVGIRPTFSDGQEHPEQKLEVHLFDYEGDLYHKQLQIDFVKRIRDEKKFNSIDDLIKQLSKDDVRCRAELK
ncbi:MAG: bifunctional riboflavin kinase/FAD synthetase [Rhodothermales bacterium]